MLPMDRLGLINYAHRVGNLDLYFNIITVFNHRRAILIFAKWKVEDSGCIKNNVLAL